MPREARLPTFVRAYTRPVEDEESPTSFDPWPPTWPEHALVFDTETTTDETQRLLFGSYRFLELRKDGDLVCRDEGLFHADGMDEFRPEGLEALKGYARTHSPAVADGHPRPMRLMTRSRFIRDVFWRVAWELEGLIVGFNLPFDLSRIAADCTRARGEFYNGFSFQLARRGGASSRDAMNVGRVRLKTIDTKRAFMGLTRPQRSWREEPFRGRLLDLRTLAFALTHRSHSLGSACDAFGSEIEKQEADAHGEVSPQYIDYNRQDTRATASLLDAAREEFDRHPVPARPDDIFSPASVAKAYLKAMHLRPPREKFKVSEERLGHAMSAFYGGRAEVKIRKTEVPVVYLDFLSMYPTVNRLLDLWAVLRAERLEVETCTDEIQELLEEIALEDCFEPDRWPDFRFFAKVRPDGDVLPTRAEYHPRERTRNIGVNPLTSDEPRWYAGPDLIASTLLTGEAPAVEEAFRLVPHGTQDGLEDVELRGEIPVDPTAEDFFRRVIEARKDPERLASVEGEDRLGSFLKVLANSGSYGIFAEMNRKEGPDHRTEELAVYGPEDAFTAETSSPESPGVYTFPPIASLIASAARLMLAQLEAAVREKGGRFVFCDTDSMAVVASPEGGLVPCPGGERELPDGSDAIRALSWEEVDELIERFERLKPYDPDRVPGTVLEKEEENFEDGEQVPLTALAVSSKRYALYREHGEDFTIVKHSEHGLGHLLNPLDPERTSGDWMRALWRRLIRDERGESVEELAWLDRPAISKLTVSTQGLLDPFRERYEGRSYPERVKPMNFLLCAHVRATSHAPGFSEERFQPIAPYDDDPERWLQRPWLDKYTRRTCYLTTERRGTVARVGVKSSRDVYERYRHRAEVTACGSGGEVCGPQTEGLLRRRPVRSTDPTLIGKESNRLEEVRAGAVQSWEEVEERYEVGTDAFWAEVVLPELSELKAEEVATRVGAHLRSVKRWRNGHTQPTGDTRERVRRLVKQRLG